MATILTKKSDTASAVPLAADLTNAAGGAELAVNATDKRLFSKTSGGTVVELGTNPSTLVLPSGSANGVAYLNGSKVVTSGSALTFDGTNLNLNSGTAVSAISGGSVTAGVFAARAPLSAHQTAVGVLQYSANETTLRSYGATGVTGQLVFNLGAGGSADAEYMRLTSTGLGIGTSSPAAKLHIKGSSNPAIYWENSSFGSATNAAFMGSAGQLVFGRAGAADWLTIDNSGNLGLGVTPSAGNATANYRLFEIGLDGGGSIYSGQVQTILGTNIAWVGGTANYKRTGSPAMLYSQESGTHVWKYAGAGTAGNAITFTQAMTLGADGNLGVGTTGATYRIEGWIASSGTLQNGLNITNGANADFTVRIKTNETWVGPTTNTPLIFANNNNTERARIDSSGNFLVGTTSSNLSSASRGVIEVNGASTAYIGLDTGGTLRGTFYSNGSIVGLATATLPLTFGTTGGTEWGRFDSSGNLLIGNTSYNSSSKGILLSNDGRLYVTTNDGPTANFNRLNSDGTVILFERNTSTVGSISVTTTATAYNTSSDYRLKNITGSITTSGAYIDSLNPVEGTWKSNGSPFVGLIAHEVQQASRTNVATGVKDGEEMQGMDYSNSELIANLIAEVKSLRQRVAQLEAQ